jgi:hypothetical protein
MKMTGVIVSSNEVGCLKLSRKWSIYAKARSMNEDWRDA